MKRPVFCALVALAALVCGAAQGAAAKPQIEKFGDWAVRCFPIKSPTPCDAFFVTFDKRTGQRIVSVSIAYAPSKTRYMMQAMVPLGVSLARGLVIAIGSYTSQKLAVRRCDHAGCFVEFIAANDLIDALKNAGDSTAVLHVSDIAGHGVPLKVSLKGFREAFDAMTKNAKDKAQPR